MNILIINTRPLCYFSADFFLDRIEEALENKGHRAERISLSNEESDFSSLDIIDTKGFDAIIDINSKLPYIKTDSGDFWLDTLDVPFFNYILDHPLYHHPGLNAPLKNYHTIGIDRFHCEYMRKNYLHLKSVDFLPIAGTAPLSTRPFKEREDPLLFMGTFYAHEKLENEVEELTGNFGKEYKTVVADLLDIWNPYEVTLEVQAERYLADIGRSPSEFSFSNNFIEFMNAVFTVDRIKRNNIRETILYKLAKEIPLNVMGEGWENSELMATKAKLLPAQFYSFSIETNGRYKYVLDINPAFLSGIHDRASNAMASGCVLISNMSKSAYPQLTDKKEVLFFKGDKIEVLIDDFLKLSESEMEEIARNGALWYSNNLSWELHSDALIAMIEKQMAL